jgi:hypothetical protein
MRSVTSSFLSLIDSDTILPSVGAADVTESAWAQNVRNNEPQELCVVVQLDQLVVRSAKVVRHSETFTWNETLL